MTVSIQRKKEKYSIVGIMLLLFVFITAGIAASLHLGIKRAADNARDMALLEARTIFDLAVLYRHWNASVGGVYAEAGATPPNPHLAENIRSKTTTDGLELVMINPAYMTRLVYAMGEKDFHIQGRIVSNKPIRPENKADQWESGALERFEGGEDAEAWKFFTGSDGKQYMRHIGALKVERECMTCHAYQGYMVGDLRGGISASFSFEPYLGLMADAKKNLIVTHAVVWLICTLVVFFAGIHIFACLKSRNKAEDGLIAMADTDVLTTLRNRRSFIGTTGASFEYCKRNSVPMCILFWDIDYFKQVNDVYGHLFGDKVLESMGAVTKACFRAQDMACRYGGEEFVAFLPGADSQTGKIAARRLMRKIEELSFDDEPDFRYTVSIGMFCAVPLEGDTLMRCISLADQALYAAKNNGRNKLVEFGSREYTTPEACLLPSPV